MSTNTLVVLCTCPSTSAKTLAEAVIHHHVAACVNILPGITSVYRWQGVVESAEEQLLVIKTTDSCYAALEAVLTSLHPYQVPEIIAFPVFKGLPRYLHWVLESTQDCILANGIEQTSGG
ncbi:Divalent-cation tolerance protein CutA [Gammaproteobacteria bacterium]